MLTRDLVSRTRQGCGSLMAEYEAAQAAHDNASGGCRQLMRAALIAIEILHGRAFTRLGDARVSREPQKVPG